MSARVEVKREEVRENFTKLDQGVEQMEDGASRMRTLRQIADLRARAAPFMAESGALRDFTVKDETGRYEGLDASDESRAAIKAEADAKVKAVAERYGVNGAATAERYSGGVPSKGLAAQFAAAEERERGRTRAKRGEGPESVDQRRQVLDRMHGEIGAIYGQARELADRGGGREAARPEAAGGRAASAPSPAPAQADLTEAAEAARRASETETARWIAERRKTERRDAAIREAAESGRREDERGIEERRNRERDNGRDGGRGL